MFRFNRNETFIILAVANWNHNGPKRQKNNNNRNKKRTRTETTKKEEAGKKERGQNVHTKTNQKEG